MPRIQGLFESGYLNQSQLIKSGPGYVFSITVGWKGLTVGDIVCILKDAVTDSANPSDNLVVVIADTANGMWHREWTQGKGFNTGLYYSEGQAAPLNIHAEVTAK